VLLSFRAQNNRKEGKVKGKKGKIGEKEY